MSSPSRTKRSSGRTRTLDVDVAGAAAERGPHAPRRSRRIRWPSWMPGGISTVERAFLDDPAGAAALAARLLDPAAGAGARGAGLGAHELAEDAPRHLLEPPGAAAGRAGRDLRARLGAVAVAARAGDGDLERHLARARRVPPRRGRSRPSPRGRPRARGRCRPPPQEDVVAEEGGEEVGEAAEVEVRRLEAAAAQARVAVAVVELARLRLRENLVRLDDLAEPLLRVRRVGDVGMELAREPAERLLDLRLARVAARRRAARSSRGRSSPSARRVAAASVGEGSALVVDRLDEAGQLGARRSGRRRAPSRSPSARGRRG